MAFAVRGSGPKYPPAHGGKRVFLVARGICHDDAVAQCLSACAREVVHDAFEVTVGK